MYIRCRLARKEFLIIETLMSPVSTNKGGGPYVELFFDRCLHLGVQVQNVKAFSQQSFCFAMLFDKILPGLK